MLANDWTRRFNNFYSIIFNDLLLLLRLLILLLLLLLLLLHNIVHHMHEKLKFWHPFSLTFSHWMWCDVSIRWVFMKPLASFSHSCLFMITKFIISFFFIIVIIIISFPSSLFSKLSFMSLSIAPSYIMPHKIYNNLYMLILSCYIMKKRLTTGNGYNF